MLIDADRADARDPHAPAVAAVARPLGIQTNNFAEYTAVALALRRALELGADEVELVLDSKLVVEQLSGRWKVRHPAIRPLVDETQALLARFRRWSIRHEPRAANFAADALANLALDDPAAARLAEVGAAVPSAPLGAAQEIGRAAVGAACAIFDDEGRVLLVRHGYGRRNWELPGGAARAAETPVAAAERELREETGLSLKAGPMTGAYYEPGHDFGPMLHFVFRMEPSANMTPVAQPPEIDEVGWWPVDDLPAPISDFTERRISDARAGNAPFGVIERRRFR